MITKLKMWLGGATVALLMLLGLRKQAKNEGRKEAQVEQKLEVLNRVEQAKESVQTTERTPVDDRIARMRERTKGNK